MTVFLTKANKFLEEPIDLIPRLFMLAAVVCLVVTYFFPLWNLTMFAPQYPDGLRLDIYSYTLHGGNHGQDIKEINVLNHYIGMHDLSIEGFTEFKWMPFVIGALSLLILRAVVIGTVSSLVDVGVLFLYFGAFSLWSFGYKLYIYGHELAPNAAVKVPPFMPPMFGHQKIANFEVYSYPQAASYVMAVALLCLAAAFFVAWREIRRERALALAA